MITKMFALPKVNAPRDPSKRLLVTAPSGVSFEQRAFKAIFNNSRELGISKVWKCANSRMDGLLETTRRDLVLLEMKTTLGWAQLQSAVFEMLAGRQIHNIESKKALIVFERFSPEWSKDDDEHAAWNQFCIHAAEIDHLLQLDAIQLCQNGSFKMHSNYKARRC